MNGLTSRVTQHLHHCPFLLPMSFMKCFKFSFAFYYSLNFTAHLEY